MLAAIRSSLKSGAHLVIVDFYKSASPSPGHIRLERDEVVTEIEHNGFHLLSKRDHNPKTAIHAHIRRRPTKVISREIAPGISPGTLRDPKFQKPRTRFRIISIRRNVAQNPSDAYKRCAPSIFGIVSSSHFAISGFSACASSIIASTSRRPNPGPRDARPHIQPLHFHKRRRRFGDSATQAAPSAVISRHPYGGE